MMNNLPTNENAPASGNGHSPSIQSDENLPSPAAPVCGNGTSLRPHFETIKIVLLALLDRIDALETEVRDGHFKQLDLRDEVSQFEGALIRAALTSTNGRQRKAARALGMKASTLNAKIQRYHVTISRND